MQPLAKGAIWVVTAAWLGLIGAALGLGCGDDPSPSSAGGDAAASSGSTPPPGADGPIAPEVAARFAILVGSCSPRTKAESILRDLYDDEGPRSLRAIAACTATKHNGCAALAECAGDTYVRTDTECRPRCDGDVYEACDDGVLARRDCAARGLVCLTDESGMPPACSDPGASTCDAGPAEVWCGADGHAHACSLSNARDVRGPRCADLGLACGANGCQGTEGSCTGPYVNQTPLAFTGTTCEGTKVRACVNGGVATFDCGRHVVGSTCQLVSDAGLVDSAHCGLGSACTLSTVGERTCDGDSAVICNRGRVDRVDCKDLGFTGCLVLPEDTDKVVCTPGVH